MTCADSAKSKVRGKNTKHELSKHKKMEVRSVAIEK